jgi:hypothetical protein
MAGVQRAMVSIASSSATVEYDEAVTSVARLKHKINECGFHCTGQIVPKHICKPHPGHVDEHGMQVDQGAMTGIVSTAEIQNRKRKSPSHQTLTR